MYAESGESSPAFGVRVTEYTQPQIPQHMGSVCRSLAQGGGVLTVAHALQEVLESLSQLARLWAYYKGR